MKRFMTMLSLVVLGFAFTSCYDDSALWDSVKDLEGKVKSLETLCNETNSNLASLQALVTSIKQGDYIVDVTPLTETGKEVGYQITFHDRGAVKIYHGKDGVNASDVPEFGAKQDTDGNYYWTVNGEWVKDDNGNKIPVVASSGVTPMLKVEDGRWYASYDEGKTWKDVGSAGSEGGSGCIFKDVKFADGNLTLTMSDGSVFVIPVGERFSIVLGDFDASSIQYGSDVVIPYSITGTQSEVAVFAVADGWIFSTKLEEETPLTGNLTIRQVDYDDEEVNGKVAIFAVAEDGTTVSKVIRLSSGVLYPTNDNYYETYMVSAEAGTLEVTVSTNRTVDVKTNADWIAYADTKAVEEKTLVFDIKENEGARRNAEIEISSGEIDFGFTVVQKGYSDAFAIDVTCDEVLGGNWTVNIDTLYNKAGQKIYEALGYSSWEEVALAAGDIETVRNRKGEVLLLAYDLYTGEALPYDEKFQHGNGFYHRADGSLTADSYDTVTSWNWVSTWIENSSYLSPEFYFNVNQRYPGETYSFGILLTSPEGEARIEVNIKVEEYKDPEKGLYDNPAAPGTYEFTICDTLDVNTAQMQYLFNNSIAEDIKSTLGMTAFEIYKKYQEYSIYTEFEFKDGYAYGRDGNGIDINGYGVGWGTESSVANLSWSFGATGMSVAMFFNVLAWGNPLVFTHAIYDALGKTVSYKYIITYNDYKLIFTHNISYVGDAGAAPGGNSLLVKSEDMVSAAWDSQFFITFDQALEEGDEFEVSMWVKSDYSATISTQTHDAPGSYIHWDAIGTVRFYNEWRKHTYSAVVPAEMAGGKTIAFILNDYQYANNYYFDNISVKINGVEQIVNGDCEDPSQSGNYWVTTPSAWMYPPTYVDPYGNVVGRNGTCLVLSNDTMMDSNWSVQILCQLAETMKPGNEYEFRCVAKATAQYDWCSIFLQNADIEQNYNYGMSLSKEWKEITMTMKADKDYDKFIFNIGDFVGQIYIDKLSLKEVGTDIELVTNGDFEEGHTNGWNGWSSSSTPYYLSEDGEGYTESVYWM